MNKKGASLGQRISRFIIVISALTVGLNLWARGLMGAEKLTLLLILVVIAAAIDSIWVKLILALAGLAFFLLGYVNYNVQAFNSLIGPVLGLLVGLFGFFVIFGGLRRK